MKRTGKSRGSDERSRKNQRAGGNPWREPIAAVNAFHQIYLHARCALRRPAHWRWHLAGMRRALAAA